MMTLEDTDELVRVWGKAKGILPNPDPMAQWEKTQEEVDELKEAILANDHDAVIDAIGDIMVTLNMQTQAWNTSLSECFWEAYKVISKRTGKMIDGKFVKDED